MTRDPFDDQMIAGIAEHGWFGIRVEEDDEGPGFTYSVGFWEHATGPEVIVFGLPKELSHSMLWEIFHKLRGGLTAGDGVRVAGLVEGFECMLRPVHASQLPEYFGYALWYRREILGSADGLDAYQVFGPGTRQGLFPWEPGCVEKVRDHQPMLYLPRETGLA